MKQKALALVEVLAVLFVAGLVAAVAIPEDRETNPERQLQAMIDSLEQVRTAVDRYWGDHDAAYPSLEMIKVLTQGSRIPRNQPGLGAYLFDFPVNPFTQGNRVAPIGAPPGSSDWVYDVRTGAFKANDSADHRAL
ncbi:MAG: hypothetical protein IID39_06540 [Planctomycetes bacterium]|nr:hypothetical protein [Planctomycetota bacterium]